MPYSSIASFDIKSSFFCTSISTGNPWVSHPPLRSTTCPSMVFHRHTMSLNSLEMTWWIPGRPFAVGGPSRKVKGLAPSRRASIVASKVPSSLQVSIKVLSKATGSRSPAGLGTPIGPATYGAVLKMPRSPIGRIRYLADLLVTAGTLERV